VARAYTLVEAAASSLRPSGTCTAAGAKHALTDRDVVALACTSWEEAVRACWAGGFAEVADGRLALDSLLGARADSSIVNYDSKSRIFFERCGVNLKGGQLSRSVEVPVGAATRPPENCVWQGRSLRLVAAAAAVAGDALLPKMGCSVADSTVSRNLYIDPSCPRSEAAHEFFGFFVQDESPVDNGAYVVLHPVRV
jgi:hypothetical protein